MSLSRRTIPYVSVEGSRDEPFDEGLQLASLYILADSIRGKSPLSATALLYYPIQIRRWDGGAVLIDMLGLNQTSFKLRRIPDVEGFGRELESASEDPGAFRKALKTGRRHRYRSACDALIPQSRCHRQTFLRLRCRRHFRWEPC